MKQRKYTETHIQTHQRGTIANNRRFCHDFVESIKENDVNTTIGSEASIYGMIKMDR